MVEEKGCRCGVSQSTTTADGRWVRLLRRWLAENIYRHEGMQLVSSGQVPKTCYMSGFQIHMTPMKSDSIIQTPKHRRRKNLTVVVSSGATEVDPPIICTDRHNWGTLSSDGLHCMGCPLGFKGEPLYNAYSSTADLCTGNSSSVLHRWTVFCRTSVWRAVRAAAGDGISRGGW